MSSDAIFIFDELCNGCRACERICSYDAITFSDNKASIDLEKCVLCMMCIKVCKVNAIQLRDMKKDTQLDHYKGVWVYIECDDYIHQKCTQILSKGYELAKVLGEDLSAILVCNDPGSAERIKSELAKYGVDSIQILYCKDIKHYHPEDVSKIVSNEILRQKPSIVLFLGSNFGRILAPRIASRIGTGLTADCTGLYIDEDNKLVQVRPTYGGRILASIVCPYDRPQMASVRPNVFEKIERNSVSDEITLDVKEVAISTIGSVKKLISTYHNESKTKDIDDAEVVICGGLGMGSKQGFDLLIELAHKMGGAVAGTRSAVDNGWIDFSQQIGQTGKTVRPKLYIGCGVSGATHHLFGMKNSDFIIAINKDSKAPILRIVDVAIVADLFEVVPQLIERLKSVEVLS